MSKRYRIVISYTNSLINKYKENKIMRDDYVHVLLFFLEIVDIPIIGKLQSKIKGKRLVFG